MVNNGKTKTVNKIIVNGETKYINPETGEIVDVCRESYTDAVNLMLTNVDAFIDIMVENEHDEYAYILQALMRDARSQFKEIEDGIDKHLGDIELIRAKSWPYPAWSIIDVAVK